MNLNDWNQRAVAHLRGLPDVECPNPRAWFENGLAAAPEEAFEIVPQHQEPNDTLKRMEVCHVCHGTGKVPDVRRNALTVLGRECPTSRCSCGHSFEAHRTLVAQGSVCVVCPADRRLHDLDCMELQPLDVAWMEAPQCREVAEGYLRAAARACGWRWDDWRENGQVVVLLTHGLTRVGVGEGTGIVEAGMACLTQAFGLDHP